MQFPAERFGNGRVLRQEAFADTRRTETVGIADEVIPVFALDAELALRSRPPMRRS